MIKTSQIKSRDLADKSELWRKVVRTFVLHKQVFVLSALTNDVTIVRKPDGGEECLFTQRALRAAKSRSAVQERRLLTDLTEPFCIGTILSSDREGKGRDRRVSRHFAKRMARLVERGPFLRFTCDHRTRSIRGSIIVVIRPLVVDLPTRRSFFPVTIGIAFDDQKSPSFARKEQAKFWSDLVTSLDEEIAELSVWDPSFINQAKLWKRGTPEAKQAASTLRRIASGRTSLMRVGHREFEEVVAELYAGLGYRVRITRYSKDGGRDIIADSVDAIPMRTIIECKRLRGGKRVGVLPVRALLGVCSDERPSRSLLVSATGFTAGASDLAKRHEHRVTLINERRLLRLIDRYVEAGNDDPAARSAGRDL
ncbi:MAG TPA: restriction endonuclease [Terriglobales bacterium]|nr:restriction endonuclease [Terriglobales bacterium]